MFWKKFKLSQSANKLFSQANEYWRQRQRFLLEGDQKRADESCVEVVRLCQQAIESDERMGDAYILLANALMSIASQVSEQAEPSQHDFLLSRGIAAIHLWYTLPYRSYPISKNAKIGEQLWRTAVQGLMHNKSLSEAAVLVSLDSYRDTLAADTISPATFAKIREAILGSSSLAPENEQMDRTSLQKLETLLKEFKSTAKQNTADLALGYEIEELLDKYRDDLKEVWQSITSERREKLFALFLQELEQSSHEESISSAQLEAMAGFLTVVFLIGYLWRMNLVGSDDLRRYMEYLSRVMTWKLNSISVELRISSTVLATSLWRIATLWGREARK